MGGHNPVFIQSHPLSYLYLPDRNLAGIRHYNCAKAGKLYPFSGTMPSKLSYLYLLHLQAVSFILNNPLRVLAVNSVGDFVLFLGKIGVMAATAAIGVLWLKVNKLMHCSEP